MLRKMKMDPLRIHNYNKFLITLDKTTVTKTEVTKTETTNVEKPKEQESTLEEQIKNKLDTIINNITEKYDENNHKSINFTGQTTSVEMDIDDPN